MRCGVSLRLLFSDRFNRSERFRGVARALFIYVPELRALTLQALICCSGTAVDQRLPCLGPNSPSPDLRPKSNAAPSWY